MAKLERGLPPRHPGVMFREDIIPHLDMTGVEIHQALGISPRMFYKLTGGESAVSPEMALRLAKFLGTSPEMWLNLQQAYDLWQVGERMAPVVERIPPARRRASPAPP